MSPDPVAHLLAQPLAALSLDAHGWDLAIRLARAGNVLARLAGDLEERGCLAQVPEAPRQHLVAALALAARQRIAGIAEIERVRDALAPQGLRCVLLKGAAYLALDLPVARGRLYGDIDLLVPRERLADAEAALLLAGWNCGEVSAYDARYYRQWMHELPPFTHARRRSVLDVHHNILPLTSREPPDARLLLAQAVEVPQLPGVWVLSPADMVLHSACHLFHEGELHNGLRDLSDLDRLLRHFATTPGFWPDLLARARSLHLTRPLHYALRYTQAILATPIDDAIVIALAATEPGGLRQAMMDALYVRGLRPMHPLAGDRWTPLARWLLYVRAHWLRMPPHLLATHLVRKAWYRFTGFSENPAQQEDAA